MASRPYELVLRDLRADAAFSPAIELFDPAFGYCFNSYYEGAGARQPRPRRGLLTRPSLERVLAYRRHVDDGAASGSSIAASRRRARRRALIELGLHHEQQHQELMLTDILALFAANPLRPAYRAAARRALAGGAPEPLRWIGFRRRRRAASARWRRGLSLRQ